MIGYLLWELEIFDQKNLIKSKKLMGIEIPSNYNGTNSSFFSSILVVEELAKVDGSVSVMCDIQNTLLNTMLMQHGSDYLKSTYLPRMATNLVSFLLFVRESEWKRVWWRKRNTSGSPLLVNVNNNNFYI